MTESFDILPNAEIRYREPVKRPASSAVAALQPHVQAALGMPPKSALRLPPAARRSDAVKAVKRYAPGLLYARLDVAGRVCLTHRKPTSKPCMEELYSIGGNFVGPSGFMYIKTVATDSNARPFNVDGTGRECP